MDSESPYIFQLRERAHSIQSRFTAILQASQFERHEKKPNPFSSLGDNPPSGPEIILRWAKLSPYLEREKEKVLADFDQLKVDLLGLFQSSTHEEEQHQIDLVRDIDVWLRYPKVTNTPKSVNDAIAPFNAMFDQLDRVLDQLESIGQPIPFLVIDTSAIIDCPDISRMLLSLGLSDATIVIPSTTIKELEDLKSSKRGDTFRRKLTTSINYLNEIMAKGNALEGVTLSKGTVLKMLAAEPDFSKLPQWLDPTINDDRILASAIELQKGNPLSNVVLIANDISMQNKALLAKIPAKKAPDLSDEAA